LAITVEFLRHWRNEKGSQRFAVSRQQNVVLSLISEEGEQVGTGVIQGTPNFRRLIE
jgi:hypothetical protein